MNKRYPHLVGKLPAPSEILSNNKLIIFGWWAREDSNLQPSGYEPLALTIELRARTSRVIRTCDTGKAGLADII